MTKKKFLAIRKYLSKKYGCSAVFYLPYVDVYGFKLSQFLDGDKLIRLQDTIKTYYNLSFEVKLLFYTEYDENFFPQISFQKIKKIHSGISRAKKQFYWNCLNLLKTETPGQTESIKEIEGLLYRSQT